MSGSSMHFTAAPSAKEIHPPAEEHQLSPMDIGTTPLHARSATGETRRPLPYANGWYAVCFSHEVKPGAVRTFPFMGQELVIYRTQSGMVRAVEPYCPHLGAHLGHGGKVDGENLVCPFHGLAFSPDGGCVRASPGQNPPKAALTGRYLREMSGAVMVWRHSEDRPPEWDIQALDLSDRLHPQYGTQELDGYGDAVAENSADLIHFGCVHGFTENEMSHEVEGHRLVVAFTARWKGQRFVMRLTSFGLGHTRVESLVPDLGVQVTTLAFTTPVSPLKWTFRLIDYPSIARLDRWPLPLRKLVYGMLNPLAHRWLTWMASDDFLIWSHRNHLKHPKLMAGERCLAAYRRWSTQFYSPAAADDANVGHVLRMPTSRPAATVTNSTKATPCA